MERRFRDLLGDGERDSSELIGDLARSSPRSRCLCPLPLPVARRTGEADPLEEYLRLRTSSSLRRLGGVNDRDRDRDVGLLKNGDRGLLSNDRRLPRPPGT